VTTPPEVRAEVFGADLKRDVIKLLRRGSVRPFVRLFGLASWTLGLLILLLIGMWGTGPWPRRRLAWRNRIVRRWARGLAWIVGMEISVEGPRPRAPFFLVANHLSYVDVVLLLAELPVVFVAKQELAVWPVLGYLTQLVGNIFVDRQSRRDVPRVLEDIRRRIEMGHGVVVFPEGTSSDGSGVQPIKPALFEWAARAEYPVHCAAIWYETRPGSPSARDVVCWWGDMAFAPHVLELLGLPGFRATLSFAPEPLVGTDRATLATRARAAIAARFAPRGSVPSEIA